MNQRHASRLRALLRAFVALGLVAVIAAPALAGVRSARTDRAHAKRSHRHKHKGHRHRRHHHRRRHRHPVTMPSSGAQSASGNFTAGAFAAQFNAARAAGAPQTAATGQFTERNLLGSATVSTVSGPVKCLDVVGNRVGLFYAITSSTPSAIAALHGGVLFSAQFSASGKPESVSFFPEPVQSVSSCAPLPGMFPITSGTLTISG